MRLFLHELMRFRDFSGRSTRREFWTFILWLFVFSLFFNAVVFAWVMISDPPMIAPTIFIPVWLAMFAIMIWVVVAEIAVGVRRLRDAGLNPLWILLIMAPFGFIVLIFMWV